jgi:hypothetical protein
MVTKMDLVYLLGLGTELLLLEYILIQRKRMMAFTLKTLKVRGTTVEVPLSAPGCL